MGTRSDDLMRLIDITDAIMEIEGYIGDATYQDFAQDYDMRQEVVEQLIQIGGAAALLSDEFKEENGEVDWDMLKGLQYAGYNEELEMDDQSLWYIVHDNLLDINDLLADLVTTLEDNEALESDTLNEEDKQDVLDRYREKHEALTLKDDIELQDNTPDPKEDSTQNTSTEEDWIESTDDVKKGPFNP